MQEMSIGMILEDLVGAFGAADPQFISQRRKVKICVSRHISRLFKPLFAATIGPRTPRKKKGFCILSALVNYTLRSLTKPFSSLSFARNITGKPAPKAPTKSSPCPRYKKSI